MIERFPGLTPTRSRAVVDMKRKGEMNRAWDEWVDTANPPMRACIGVDLEPPHVVEIVVTAAK